MLGPRGRADQALAVKRKRVADKFVAEAEAVEAVAAHGAVAQADDNLSQQGLELVLQLVERLDRVGGVDLAADVKQGGRKLAGFLRRHAGKGGVDADKYRADDAAGGERDVDDVAVAIHERLRVVVDVG